jgi:hypothetical protein
MVLPKSAVSVAASVAALRDQEARKMKMAQLVEDKYKIAYQYCHRSMRVIAGGMIDKF